MSTPTNILQAVKTYNRGNITGFPNQNCFIGDVCNTEHESLLHMTANLGTAVGISLPYSFIAGSGLIVSEQPVQQNLQTLTVNQSAHTAIAVTNQERIFNLDKDQFWSQIGRGMVTAVGAEVEKKVASHIVSGAIDEDAASATYGQKQYLSGPYRFFDRISSGISSYQDLEQIHSDFISLGASATGHKMILPTNKYAPIVGSGLSQFVIDRNEREAQSWLVGDFGTPRCSFYRSNQLPLHTAGSLGIAGTTLTVVSTNDPTGANITQITCSGAGAGTVVAGDLGYFLAASGLRALTFNGKTVTDQLVQFRVTANTTGDGSNIVLNVIAPSNTEGQGLCSTAGSSRQNINLNIVAGMTLKLMGSHRAGLLVTGDGFYLAMPKLDEEDPYKTSVETDPETKVSLRMYYGSRLGMNSKILVNDCIWGAVLVPRCCARILLAP